MSVKINIKILSENEEVKRYHREILQYSPIDTNSKPMKPYVRKNTTKTRGRSSCISVDNTIGRVKTQKNRKVLDICTSGYVCER